MDTTTDKQLIGAWRESMEQFVVRDIRDCLRQDSMEVGLIILTMVGIDCISGYFAGKPADPYTFKEFVTSDYFPSTYHKLGDDLYHLRNGLIHDYTSKDERFVFFRREGDGPPHLSAISRGQSYSISLNRETFAKDLLQAWDNYSRDVVKHMDMTMKVLRRLAASGRGFLIVAPISHFPTAADGQNQMPASYQGGTTPWRGTSRSIYNGDQLL